MQKIKYDLNVLDKAIADMQKLAAKYKMRIFVSPIFKYRDLMLTGMNIHQSQSQSIVQNDLKAAVASLSKTVVAFGELVEATEFALSTARTNIMLVDVLLADEFRKDEN